MKPTLVLLFRLLGLCLYVSLFGMYEDFYAIIHKIGLFTLAFRYERQYFSFCVVSVVLDTHEISHASIHKIKLQALYYLETVSKNILGIS